MQEIIDVIKQLGVPTGLLIFLGIGLWRVLVWVGNKVVVPIKDAHIELVKSAQQTNEINSKTLDKIANLVEQNDARDKATYTLVVETHEIVKGFKPKE